MQRGIDRVEVLAREQEIIAAHVPGDVPRIGHDLVVGRRCDEAFPGFFKIALVCNRKRVAHTFLKFDGVGRGRFALVVEMVIDMLNRGRYGSCLSSKNAGVEARGQCDGQRATEGLVVHEMFLRQSIDAFDGAGLLLFVLTRPARNSIFI
ncbi:hypothetical protein D9M71_516210 [compost metagenome]